MAAVTDEQVETVRALVAAIPAGKVATYGDIASAAGLSSPRIVGWIMRTDSSDLPWHRVITASGRPAPHLATRQLELLRAEGVLAVDGRIARLAEVATTISDVSSSQSHQRGGAGQARERGRRRTRMKRVHGKAKHQRAQQHLRPLRQRAPSLDETVIGLAPGQRVDHHHARRPRRGPPVRGDVGDTRGGGAGEKHGAVKVAVYELAGALGRSAQRRRVG